MAVALQVPSDEVLGVVDDQFRRIIELIGAAIEKAWATTLRQIEEADFDDRISQTAFAQFLVHNVRNEIFRLGSRQGEVETDLIPNRRKSAHHIVVKFKGFRITVSAVKRWSDRPRPARFRADYARQLRFAVNEGTNAFEVAPPPQVGQRIHTYIQMLHGPTPENRQVHGFTLIAFTNGFGEYEPKPIDIIQFLGLPKQHPKRAAEEAIQEQLGIEIRETETSVGRNHAHRNTRI